MNNKHLIISDELLSAFLDGNTSADDSMRVLKAAQHDKDLQEIIRIASEVDEDIYLDEFSDEIDQWIIDAIKAIGLDTAKAVLNAPRDMLVEKADLEEETVDNVLKVLKAEFE